MGRARIREEIQVALFSASRRRCCLCATLHYDNSVKRGQIAHLNHDPSDSRLDNLVWLCLRHHDIYDSRTSQSKGLSEAEVRSSRDELYARISQEALSESHEIDFLQAYMKVIDGTTRPSDRYADILSRHLHSIRRELGKMREQGNWKAVLDIRARLREYFEYSGRYSEGTEFGCAYAEALRALGDLHECWWVRVKDIGYMLILDGQHQRGREELKSVLQEIASSSKSKRLASSWSLQFYAYRYLGISYHRAPRANYRESLQYFHKARKCMEHFPKDSIDYRALSARLQGNIANLALDEGDPKLALSLYQESLSIFHDLDDLEHVGIANLNIAKALICLADMKDGDPLLCLSEAQSLFSRIGWIEGQGRVYEQRARFYLRAAQSAESQSSAKALALRALDEAQTAMDTFRLIKLERLRGRVEALTAQVREFNATVPEQRDAIVRRCRQRTTPASRRSGPGVKRMPEVPPEGARRGARTRRSCR